MRRSFLFLFIGCSLLLLSETLRVCGGVAYPDPPGGWTYIYNGDQLTVADDASGFASLDGTWSHNNGSDQWDGSVIGGAFTTGGVFGMDNAPGGANLITENGVSYLRMQDTGDPRDYGYTDPCNRKEADGGGTDVMDTGIALTGSTFRKEAVAKASEHTNDPNAIGTADRTSIIVVRYMQPSMRAVFIP